MQVESTSTLAMAAPAITTAMAVRRDVALVNCAFVHGQQGDGHQPGEAIATPLPA